jgi:transcriptional regulator with XRE-family HTH domain
MFVDVQEMKRYIESLGIKQKTVAENSGLDETKLCLSLQGKRKFEAGEYASVCKALNLPMTKFIKPKELDQKGT